MKLREYYLGRRFGLLSFRSPQEVKDRINAASGSVFSPMGHGVTGWCRFGRFTLWWKIPMFSNGFAPVLRGRFRENLGGTEIRATYGWPTFVKVFLTFWYGFLSLISLLFLFGVAANGTQTGNEWIMLVMVPLFFAFPIALTMLTNRNAERHLETMLEFLEREAGAKLVER